MDQTPSNPQPSAPVQTSGLKAWIWSVAAKKAAWGVAKFVTSVVTSTVVMNALHKFGITVDPQVFMPAVSALIMAGLEFAHDGLKLKTGLPFF